MEGNIKKNSMQMKESGKIWIGLIPSNWIVTKIKYLYNMTTGFTPDTTQSEYFDENDGRVWVTINDLKYKYIKDSKLRITDAYIKQKKPEITKKGSLLYSFKLSIGKVAFADIDLYTNEAIASFKNTNKSNLNYLFYVSCLIEHNSNINIYGAKILNQELIHNSITLYPPLDEQKKIVNFLDFKCEKIDKIIEKIYKQIEILKGYKQSVIAESISKGLNKKVKIKKSKIPWINGVPYNWEEKPNKYIMKKINDICANFTDEKIMSLSMKGICERDLDAGGKMPASFNGYQYLYKNNLLMCLFDYDVTPRCIGIIEEEGVTSPAYSQFELLGQNYSRYYYYYYLMVDNTKEILYLAKNLRYSFTEDELGRLYVPVPPIKEQHQIVDFLDKKCSKIDNIIDKKSKQIDVLERYKKSLIYEYVTGKKRV